MNDFICVYKKRVDITPETPLKKVSVRPDSLHISALSLNVLHATEVVTVQYNFNTTNFTSFSICPLDILHETNPRQL